MKQTLAVLFIAALSFGFMAVNFGAGYYTGKLKAKNGDAVYQAMMKVDRSLKIEIDAEPFRCDICQKIMAARTPMVWIPIDGCHECKRGVCLWCAPKQGTTMAATMKTNTVTTNGLPFHIEFYIMTNAAPSKVTNAGGTLL